MFMSLFSCSSQEDSDIGVNENQNLIQQSTRGVEEYENVNFHFCVTYSPLMTNCAGFVSFSKILLYNYYSDDAYNPPLIGLYYVDAQTQCLGGAFNYEEKMTCRIPKKYMLIDNERWYLTVVFNVASYMKTGDYRVTLYNAFYEDWTVDIGKVVFSSVQGLYECQIPMTELMNEYTGQKDFNLQLYVAPN